MSAMAGRPDSGLVLLNIARWLRRQTWLRIFYRHLPQSLRDRVLARFSARAIERARFPRTPAWSRPVASASREAPDAKPVSGCVGANLLGYLRGQFGLAESARMYARAMISAGMPVSLLDIDLNLRHGWDDRSLDPWLSDDLPHPISILFVNPDMLEPALEHIGRARLQGRYLIACWFWELENVPEDWLPAIGQVDEILVASKFVEDAFRRATGKPILRVPIPLSDTTDSGLQRADFGLEEDCFVFLCTFDFNSWIARKNPEAAIAAFRLAFDAQADDVRLLIKTINGFRHQDAFYQLLAAAAGDPRIVIRDDIIDGAHVRALQRCCDAYVSLHRAEGFGLGLAEMMLAGKPVIATGWSGNLEFMGDDNSCLVGHTMVKVADGEYLAGTDLWWAEADTAEAAAWMRRLVRDRELAARIGQAASASIRDALSPQRAAKTIGDRLASIEALLPTLDFVHSLPRAD